MAKTREELLQARAARDEAATAAREAHDFLVLELEDRFSTELGKRGVAFEIANEENSGDAGPIVVKRGEAAAFKAYQSKDGASLEDTFAFVSPAVVYPDKPAWNAISMTAPALVYRACAALLQLYGSSRENFKVKP